MAGVLTLADGRTRTDVSLTEPAAWSTSEDVVELTLTELDGFIEASCLINKTDYRLSAAASDTVPDGPLCEEGTPNAPGLSNYEGVVTVLRFIDPDTGRPDPEDDVLYDALGEKGVHAWYAERIGPKARAPWEVGDSGWIYYAIQDEPQEPQDRNGYIKNPCPPLVQTRRRFVVVEGS